MVFGILLSDCDNTEAIWGGSRRGAPNIFNPRKLYKRTHTHIKSYIFYISTHVHIMLHIKNDLHPICQCRSLGLHGLHPGHCSRRKGANTRQWRQCFGAKTHCEEVMANTGITLRQVSRLFHSETWSEVPSNAKYTVASRSSKLQHLHCQLPIQRKLRRRQRWFLMTIERAGFLFWVPIKQSRAGWPGNIVDEMGPQASIRAGSHKRVLRFAMCNTVGGLQRPNPVECSDIF